MTQTSVIKNVPGLKKASKLIIFVCGSVPPAVTNRIGGYHELYTAMFEQAIEKYGSLRKEYGESLTITSYMAFESEFPKEDELSKTDFYLISGSKFNAYDEDPWILHLLKLLQTVYSMSVHAKIFGVCFGHQIIARAFQGVVGPSGSWEVGTYNLNLSELGQQIFHKNQLNIQQMHRDIVTQNPPGFEIYASNAAVPNHGMVKFADGKSKELENIKIITVQGHPEFSSQTVDEIIDFRKQGGIFNEDEAKIGYDHAKQPADSLLYANILLQIIATSYV